MKQLTGLDSMFVQMERRHQYAHVAGLTIYDPSSAPGGKVRFKEILRFFSERIEQFPQFRRRLVTVPLSLDHPYWVQDPEFDVEFHVRHIALPEPGDWRQLCIQVARLHSRPLDPSKPLWEVYVIEGLENVAGPPPGSFALYMKFHHALFDGESAAEMNRALHSLTPDLPEDLEDRTIIRYADREPRPFEIYSRALAHNVTGLPKLAAFGLRTIGGLVNSGARGAAANPDKLKAILGSLIRGDLSAILPAKVPTTRFSGAVSAHRVFEAVALSMADIKTIRQQVPGVTVNDVFMSVVGGALQRYLSSKDELPDASMLALVPTSLRGSDKVGEGNQVGFTLMSVHSDVTDPLERLLAAHESGAAAKRSNDIIGKDFLLNLLEAMPAPLAALLHSVKLPALSLCVSNVRGPDVALYLAGARMVAHLPISIILDGVALNCTGLSYAGTLWVCALSCREILPDPAFFAECLRGSFDELKLAAAEHASREAALSGAQDAADARSSATPAVKPTTRADRPKPPRRRVRPIAANVSRPKANGNGASARRPS
jgi:WS/DGAT/MGAT family acyltransferase